MLLSLDKIATIAKLLKEICTTIESYLDRNKPTLPDKEKPN